MQSVGIDRIETYIITTPSGTSVPSAGLNGELGEYALKSDLENISNDSMFLQGSLPCDILNFKYTVYHQTIDTENSIPFISLTTPSISSILYIQNICNRTPNSFDTILSDIPDTTGYYINWIMSVSGKNALIVNSPVITGNFVTLDTNQIITGIKTFNSSLLPGAAGLGYSLGSPSAPWDELYVSNSSIHIGPHIVSADESGLSYNGEHVPTASEISTSIIIGITGQNGIQVQQVSLNNFIISLYNALTGNLNVTQSSNEKGSSVSTANLSWSFNKPIISQSINNSIGSLPTTATSYNYTPVVPITANTTFTLTASDGTTTINPSTTVSFYNSVYWGTVQAVSGGTPSNNELLNGNHSLASSRNKSITFNCAIPVGGNYFYYAYPVSFGLSSVTVNNLTFSDWYDPINPPVSTTTPYTFSVTNSNGYTTSYYLYRVYNSQNSSSITVVFQ